MRVVELEKIEELGRIPRSSEGHHVDALEKVKEAGNSSSLGGGEPNALIIFLSRAPRECTRAHARTPRAALQIPVAHR